MKGWLPGQVARGLCYAHGVSTAVSHRKMEAARHSAMVRVTHWITVISFFALLITGVEILISHPRFYWGEVGNVMTRPLFTIPIPSSRDTVPTGYGYVLPDQNGWSRYLHFQSAWLLVLTGAVYGIYGVVTGHFWKNLFPVAGERGWRAYLGACRAVFAKYLSGAKYVGGTQTDEAGARTYNVVQRTAYLSVIFLLFPLVIWTGLALSPAFDAAVPAAVNLLGGRQSARTLHFFVSGALVVFLVIHVAMVVLAGFRSRMRAMITGRAEAHVEADVEARKERI